MATKRRPAPPPPAAPRGLIATWAVEKVPDGVPFTGVLRTPHASPALALAGVALGVLAFLTFTPVITTLLGLAVWAAEGSPGKFRDFYNRVVGGFQQPAGMAVAQLGIALLIPISAALVLTLHHVRPSYLFSVGPGLRWRSLVWFVPLAIVVMNGVLWLTNVALNRPGMTGPEPAFWGYVLVVLLTTPLQAAAEEVFFRGYLLQAFGSLSVHRWFGIVGSALVFALFHGTQNPWLFASRFVFGVLAAWLVVRTGGLEAGVAAHVINNVFAFLYAGLSTGVAAARTVTEISPMDAVGEIVMYAVYTAVAVIVAGRLGLSQVTAGSRIG